MRLRDELSPLERLFIASRFGETDLLEEELRVTPLLERMPELPDPLVTDELRD